MQPIILIDTVALTTRHLPLAPRLNNLAQAGWSRPLREVLPAVTCTAQASMLTGKLPSDHGIVGNGWLFRDTMEVRFWQQSNRLVQAEEFYVTLRKRQPSFRCAKLFWWFNQGADVAISVTPKPHYGADGNKAFDILSTPFELAGRLKKTLGPFPFATFWGPMAGLACTQWIAQCAATVVKEEKPDVTLVYLPHLDYDTQRLGPDHCAWPKLVGELDAACAPLLDAAKTVGARVWVTNEYTHLQVDQPIFVNRALRRAGLLTARPGPFGETLDTFESEAFAVCDHQLAHVYLKSTAARGKVRSALAELAGIERIYEGDQRADVGLDHGRAGDFVLLAKPNAWFAYPFWLDDKAAPDYARTVDIHRKPGYDPCELLFDPGLLWAKGHALRRLVQKKLGMRTLFDLISLDATLVKGSHGRQVSDQLDRPVLIGDGPAPAQELAQTDICSLLFKCS